MMHKDTSVAIEDKTFYLFFIFSNQLAILSTLSTA